MTLYRINNDKVCIGLVSDDGCDWNKPPYRFKYKKIIDAPPFARWAIGKETYHVLRWFRQRGFKVQSKRLSTMKG